MRKLMNNASKIKSSKKTDIKAADMMAVRHKNISYQISMLERDASQNSSHPTNGVSATVHLKPTSDRITRFEEEH